ncbi:MAG: chitobiase/beta-hexosaminidase C-terminal domain-containing protein [Oscillospiraceae bacterium]|nr:chitobiase/beta-hexosaminidase C-terminal domain-containing protein [Oscillospiraceae bacterium]
MAVYLHDKFAPKIEKAFRERSVVKGRFSNRYSFDGVRTLKVMSLETAPLVDYARNGANRYGEPSEVQDTYQTIVLEKDRAFSKTIDKGNHADQGGLKAAGTFMALQVQERYIPEYDAYMLQKLASKAGTIVANSSALTKSTVLTQIGAGMAALDDAEVPADGRTIWVKASVLNLIRLSDEFTKIEELGLKGVKDGRVGELFGAEVVKVPAGRWPAGVNFIIAHKDAAVCAEKIHDTKIHEDPPGINGNLIEGRFYYGGEVLAAKCGGVYAEVTGTVLAAPSISAAGAITGASGATFWYTTDGSDPRYSGTRKTGTQSDVTAAGTVVKAYAEKTGSWDSPVTTVTLA